jgi:hypothetical protein
VIDVAALLLHLDATAETATGYPGGSHPTYFAGEDLHKPYAGWGRFHDGTTKIE